MEGLMCLDPRILGGARVGSADSYADATNSYVGDEFQTFPVDR